MLSALGKDLYVPAIATREFVTTFFGAVAGTMSDCIAVDTLDLDAVNGHAFSLAAARSVAHFLQRVRQRGVLLSERLFTYRRNCRISEPDDRRGSPHPRAGSGSPQGSMASVL